MKEKKTMRRMLTVAGIVLIAILAIAQTGVTQSGYEVLRGPQTGIWIMGAGSADPIGPAPEGALFWRTDLRAYKQYHNGVWEATLSQYMTYNGSAVTSTVPILLSDGTALNPSLAFANSPLGAASGGFYRHTLGEWTFRGNSNQFVIRSATPTLRFQSNWYLGWASGDPTITVEDTMLSREAAATLQLGADAATATAQTIKGPDSTGAGIAGANLTFSGGNGTNGDAAGGHLVLRGGANAGTGEEGVVRFSDEGTKPTCAAGIRGAVWYDAGAGGVADTFEVCRKDAVDAYAWVSLF